jgi:hypothetical protein
LAVMLAAVFGVLAVFGSAAHALIAANHCEPLRRRQDMVGQ